MFLGLLGLDRETMNDTRAGDLYTRLYWYHRKERENRLEQFRLTRLQTFELINIQLRRQDKIRKPSDLWHIPEDDEGKEQDASLYEGRTQEQLDRLVELMEKHENG